MRLLRVEADGNFSLVEREGRNIPFYAILSHTWGDDQEEVTFKDLTNGTGQTKAGYSKLRFCGKQATQDKLEYFWVDTCCIDKSSSAELSEAINSMFRWYRDATRCYVYLSDVSVGASSSRERQPFLNSRWFTRGWTVQELLAPQSLQFFSSEGCLLGSKDLLFQEIATTTGISVEALRGKPLSQFSVQERMSWAERRETKREEDAAYCLLGMFNIQIPLIYGEGRQNAMRRLLNEIESRGGLDRILKWLAPPEFATVYHESVSERESDTGQWIFSHSFFRSWLNGEHPTKTLGRLRWIHGHPGGGKTTLAASVIQYLSSGQHGAPSAPEVYYFFFRHDNPSHTMLISACRSILSQFIQRHSNRQDIVEEFHTTIDHGRKLIGQSVSSEPELLDLLQKSLKTLPCVYI
ncbi:HET-domain-containing protein, partial [Macroventuria anomochaeta]